MSINLRPLADLVVVEELPGTNIMPSGLVVPNASLWFTTGKVIAAGPDAASVDIDDVVLYNKKAGAALDVPGVRVIGIKEVVGVVED